MGETKGSDIGWLEDRRQSKQPKTHPPLMTYLAHVRRPAWEGHILTSEETVRAKNHLFSKGGSPGCFLGLDRNNRGLARYLPHKEDEIQKRTKKI